MGLRLESNKVMVMVESVDPSATTGPEPVIVEVLAEAESAVKLTVPPLTLTGVVMDKVLISDLVEVSEHVETPVPSLLVHTP